VPSKHYRNRNNHIFILTASPNIQTRKSWIYSEVWRHFLKGYMCKILFVFKRFCVESFVWIRRVEIFILNFSRYRVLLARACWCRRQHTILDDLFFSHQSVSGRVMVRIFRFMTNLETRARNPLWRLAEASLLRGLQALVSRLIYDVFWRHRNLNTILQIAIWLSEYPGWDSRTPPWTTVLQFVNNMLPRAFCKLWFQLSANFMSGYNGYLSKILFKVRWKFDRK
jgi:hypothetical protein